MSTTAMDPWAVELSTGTNSEDPKSRRRLSHSARSHASKAEPLPPSQILSMQRKLHLSALRLSSRELRHLDDSSFYEP